MSTRTGPRPTGGGAGTATGDPDREPRAGRAQEGVGRWALGGLAVVVLAVGVSLGTQFLVDRVPVAPDTVVPTALLNWAAVAALALAVGILVSERVAGAVRDALSVAVLAFLATVVVALPLQATNYYLMGITEDQLFRTQYLTRLADSAVPADMNYADIASFYPPGWFWVGGRLADLFDVPAWLFYKPWALTTLAVVPAAAYWVWSRLVGPRVALAVGLALIAAGLGEAATEPYSWLIGALLPAVVVVFWRSVAPGGRWSWSRLVGIGVFVGVALSVYTLHAGFGALVLAFLSLLAAWVAGPGHRRTALARTLPALGVVASTSAVVAAPAWGRYLLAVLRGESGDHAAARFLPLPSAELPLPMLEPTVWGAFLAVGTVHLLWQATVRTAADHQLCLPLAVLAGGVYAWYGLSTAALAFDTTLLAFRLEPVLQATLAVSAVLALRRGWRLAGQWWLPRPQVPVRGVLAVLSVLAVLLGTGALRENVRHLDRQVQQAYADPYPSGPDARGVLRDDAPQRWVAALAAAIDAGTGRPAGEVVVLTTNYPLLAVHPYRGFQQNVPHYANPLAHYTDRARYIEELAGSATPAELRDRLDASPWRPPTVFVLERGSEGLHLQLGSDVFPGTPNIHLYDVVFDEAVFEGWAREDVGPYAVFLRPDR